MDKDIDLLVIGAGSGGVRAARLAAQAGARVVVVEAGPTGGTCVNVGCIPKKLYSYAAHYADAFEEARGYGWSEADLQFDWPTLKSRRAAEIARLNGIYERILAESGAHLLHGRAKLTAPHEVRIDAADGSSTLRAAHVLVATGSHAVKLAVPGAEHAVVSDAMFDLPTFPRRLAVVGAGYIACEMASIFHGLGAEVTQVVRGNTLLRGFDADIGGFLADEMVKKGVRFAFGRHPTAVSEGDGGLRLHLDDDAVLAADVVLMATGRVPNTTGLGLAELGVGLHDNGALAVDERGASSLPWLHAVGDVTGGPQLTPVALAQAAVVVDRLFGRGERRFDASLLPTAVFTHPNVGTIGLAEAQARARLGELRIYRADFKPLKHTLSGSGERCLVKLVVEAATDRVVGLHMVGPDAGEVVQGFAVAMGMGATKAQFDATLGIHPTLAEEFVTLRTPVPIAAASA